MTTYLLHGGATSKNLPGNDEFFTQFHQIPQQDEVKVLLCYWSREHNRWDHLIERDSSTILKNCSKKVSFEVAQDPEDLFAKLSGADVLYVAGGDAELIEPFYQELGSLKQQLEGKIYAGSSMGAFLAAEKYVLSFDEQKSAEVHEGVGLVPLNLLCHWDLEDRRQEKLSLLSSASGKPIVTLNEGEFVSLYY